MFDDLVPQSAAASPQGGGMFEDLIPKNDAAQAQGAREAAARRAPRPGRDVPQYDRDEPSSNWQDVGNAVGRIVPKAHDAMAETVGRAADVVPFMVNRAVRGQNPVGHEPLPTDVHPVESTWKYYFGSEGLPPAQSFPQQIADAGGKMLGENMPFMAATSKLAGAGRFVADAAPTIKNAAKSGYNAVMDAFAKRPVGAVASETGASLESGGLGEWMRNHQEEAGRGPLAQRLAEMAGQMGGPTGMLLHPVSVAASAVKPLVAPGVRLARKGVGAIAEALPEENVPAWMKDMGEATARERTAGANATVNKELTSVMAKPEAKAGLEEAQRLEQEIPGFKPGLARATNDPVLLNTQRKLDSEATGNELRQSQEAHDQNSTSLRNKFESLAPKVDNPADAVHGAEAARVQGEQTKLKSEQGLVGIEQDATNRKLKSAAEALPDAERADAGAKFREQHDYAELASDKNTEMRRAKIADADSMIPVGDGEMTINQALDRRSAILQEQRKYASTVGTVEGANKMAELSAERATLDRAIENVNKPGMEEYRRYYRDEHVPKFEEGAGRDVGRYDRFGYDKNKVPDEKVLEQFGGPNNISAAKQFTATHGDNPEMVRLMADHQLGRLKKDAVDPVSGTMREGAVDKFLAKNRELLDALPPGVREAVSARNPKDLHAKLGELEQRQRALADTVVTSRLGKNPEDTIHAAMNDWQVMRDLKQSLRGNVQHEAALTRAVMDKAPDPTNAAKFGDWLDKNGRMLREVITPQHLNDLKTIAKASEMHARLPRPSGAVELPPSLGRDVGQKTGLTPGSIAGSILGVARGRSSEVVEGTVQGFKLANRLNDRAVNAAWREALSNPDMAKTLGTIMRSNKATPMQISKMHTYLLASGLIPSNVEDEQK